MSPMRAVVAGQIYEDVRNRALIPRQVKVLSVGTVYAEVANTISSRKAFIPINRLLKGYRFKLVSQAPEPSTPHVEPAVPATAP